MQQKIFRIDPANDSSLNERPFISQIRGPQKWKIFSIVAVVLLAVASLAFYWFVYLDRFVSTDDAYVESDVFSVNSRIMGYIKDVPVIEGARVKKDDVLTSMDSNDVEFERNYKQMKLDKLNVDFKRARTLHASTAISDFDLENAEASLKAAEVDLEGTKIKLSYMKVVSPSNGFVAKKSVAPGQFVQPGQTLFIVVDPSHPWIKANFKETQSHALKQGQPVKITIDAYPDRVFHGRVESVYPATGAKLSIVPAENATGNFTRIVQRLPVRISIDDSGDAVMRPGLSARVEVDARSKK